MIEDSKMWKEMEYSIFDKVDLIYYPSILEVNAIKSENPNLNCKVLQPYAFSNVNTDKYDFDSRTGILFVGGFRHGPNYDGIKWFIDEVFNKVLEKEPDIVLHVAGSYPPEELVLKANDNKNLVIEGFVTDSQLEELYKQVRLVVVPLRYGAGIKGKVIEAMSMGVPVITTSCGAEGVLTDALYVDDTMESVSKYYNDKKWLEEHSRLGVEFIKKEYSIESAKSKILKDFSKLNK